MVIFKEKNWIKRKNELESTMRSPEMKRIADEIDEEVNVVSNITKEELTVLKTWKICKSGFKKQFLIENLK